MPPDTVTYMSEEPAEIPATDARTKFADLLNAAAVRGQITYITQRGRRVAAIVPVPVAEAAEKNHG
jgi:prevent-host-death family protein